MDTLQATLDAIKKKFGNGALFVGTSSNTIPDIQFLRSGSLALDIALGGGYPWGRIIELFGPPGAGKTSLALHAIASAQKTKPNKTAAIIDSEYSLDPVYAKNLNVDLTKLIISQPDNAEQGLEIVDDLVRSNQMSIIVVDSAAALVPQAELDGEMSDQHIGLQARLISKALRKLTGIVAKSESVLFFTNQMRQKIGMMGYGSQETSACGNALKFYASQRIEVKRIGSEKHGEDIIGNRIKIKILKNKVASPYKEIELCITFGRGVNRPLEILEAAEAKGIIKRSGTWYSYLNQAIAQGKGQIVALFDNKPELLLEIEDLLRQGTL